MTSQSDDPLAMLDLQYTWYRTHAVSAARRYRVLEMALLTFAALPPVSTAFAPPWITAVLGATVFILTGARSILGWQDQWVRFTEAWVELQGARSSYINRLPPYDDDNTRASVLVHSPATGAESLVAMTRGS